MNILTRIKALGRHRTLVKTVRLASISALDGLVIVAALRLAAAQTGGMLAEILARSGTCTLVLTSIAVGTFLLVGLYRRRWRFISFSDGLFLAATVAGALAAGWAAALACFPDLRVDPTQLLPFVILHGALVLVAMAAMRVVRRSLRDYLRRKRALLEGPPIRTRRALLLGDMDWARAMIELIRTDIDSGVEVVGVLSPDALDRDMQVAGVPVLGSPDFLSTIIEALERRGRKPSSIVMRDDGATMPRRDFMRLVALADKLNLVIARTGDPWSQMAGAKPRLDLEYLQLADLLGRPEIKLERTMVRDVIAGRRVLVTGAGGTIGSELVRQLAAFAPSEIVLLDNGEYNLYAIDMEMRERFAKVKFHTALCSIRQKDALFQVFARHRPDIVFHAAALKHVPLVEANPCAGVHTNVIGTRNVADAVCEFGARAMVQISTDKAVNPVGMMGVTKRLGELYCQALDLIGACDPDSPRFMTVRFGNVLGSSGSLVPLLQRQLASGKPLTVTHPDIERFFMTVEEAVQLILTSSAHALEQDLDRGTIFVLDMGEPIKIVDIAKRIIRLAGLEPDVDVQIQFIGLRPGEKLYEELFDVSEERFESRIPGIFEARPCPIPLPQLMRGLAEFERLVHLNDADTLRLRTRALMESAPHAKWSVMIRQSPHEVGAEPADALTAPAAAAAVAMAGSASGDRGLGL